MLKNALNWLKMDKGETLKILKTFLGQEPKDRGCTSRVLLRQWDLGSLKHSFSSLATHLS